jgi:hypothetical protein
MFKSRDHVRNKSKSKKKDPLAGPSGNIITTSGNAQNSEEVQNDAERRLYKHKMPEQDQGFSDLINGHERGTKFPFVMVSTDDGPSEESRISYLQRFQALIQSKSISIPNRINLNLIKEVEEMSFQSILNRKVKMPFVLLKRAVVMITPLSSMFDTYTDVVACIIDKRFRGTTIRQELKLSSNKDYTGEMSLDYSIPIKSLDKVFFSITLETPIMNTGEQWAACQMELDFEESDYPMRPNFRPVLAVSSMPASGLTNHKFNPMRKDLTIHNSHRDKLMDMYLDGDLSRPSDPEADKTGKLIYSQTSAPPKSIVKKPSLTMTPYNDWDAVRNRKPDKVPIGQNSVSIPDDPNEILPSPRSSIALSDQESDVQIDFSLLNKLNHGQSSSMKKTKKDLRFQVQDA